MSKLVDERIVQMGFDNSNFEKNVKTSMSTIDKLKSSLNFSGVSNTLNKNLSSVDTSPLQSGISQVANGFSVMEIAAITAIANITSKVVDLGLQMVKSLSVDNIATGWSKYAEKTTSVATLVSQGYAMDTVNTALEKLLWYTDETSYSFTDMVSNISKFTATGQGLDESVQAMMGIANWAALSGQNAEVASRAMYQLSQAMGSGIVRLQDWKSIQNANMDTKEFRQNALDTAVALGTLTQSIDGTYSTLNGKTFNINQFTTELDEGWFTSDVLMGSLSKYSSAVDTLYEKVKSDDSITMTSEAIEKYGSELDTFGLKAFKAAQEAKTLRDALNAVKDAAGSAWMTTFETIFGQYDLAKGLWSDLAGEMYEIFVDGLNYRNKVLGEWAKLGGRDDLFAKTEETTGAFWNLLYAIKDVLGVISDAWKSIFGFSQLEEGSERVTDIAQKTKNFTARLREMAEGLRMSEETATIFKNVLRGVFSVIKVVTKTIGALWTGLQPLLNLAKSLAGQLFKALGIAGDGLANFVTATDAFQIAGQKMAAVMQNIVDALKSFNLLERIKIIFNQLISSFRTSGGNVENLTRIFNGLKAALEILKMVALALYSVFKKYLLPILQIVLTFLAKVAGTVGGTLVRILAWVGDAIVKFAEFLKSSVTFQKIISGIGTALTGTMTVIKGVFSEFGKVDTSGVDTFNDEVTDKFSPLKALLEGLADLFSGLWSVLKAVVPVIGKLFSYIGNVLSFLGKKLGEVFSGDSSFFTIERLMDVAFWTAILISIYKVINVFTSIQDALRGVVQGFADVLDAKAMSLYAEALKTLAMSLLILVGALVILSLIPDEKLGKSLGALTVLIGLLMGMAAIMKGLFLSTEKFGITGLIAAKAFNTIAFAMIEMAAAILIMAFAVRALATLDQDQLMNGIMGVVMIVGIMLGAAAIVGKNEKTFKKGAKGLIKMALAVWLMAKPVQTLGKMDPKQMQQGIVGVASIVAMCVIFARATSAVKGAKKTAAAMIPFAIALLIATIPLKIVAKMGWEKLAIGLTGVLGLAAIMVALGTLSKYMKKSLTTAFAMIMFAEAMLIASIPLRIIGGMGWNKLAVGMAGMLGIASMMVVIGLMGKRIKKLVSTAFAMQLMGVAMIEFAIAMKVLGSMKWESLAKAGVAMLGIVAIMVLISKVISGTGVLSIIGFSLALGILAASLLIFAIAVAALNLNSWASLGKALLVLVAAMAVLAVAAYLLTPVVPVMLGLGIALTLFAAAALILSIALSSLIVVLGTFGGIIGTVLIKLADAIIEAGPKIIQAVGVIVQGILDIIIQALPKIFIIIGELLEGILTVLVNYGPRVIETVIMLLDNLLKSLAAHFPSMVDSIISMIITLLTAIKDNIGTIIDIVLDVIINLLLAIKAKLPVIIETVVDVAMTAIEALVKTIVDMVPRLVTAAFDLILGIIEGLGQAIEDNAARIRETMLSFCNHLWKAFLNFFGINSPSTKFFEAAGWMIEGLWNGLKAGWESVVNWFKGIANSIGDFFKNAWNGFVETGKNVINGIWNGLKSGWETVSNWFGNTAKSIGNFFSNTWNSLVDTGKNIINKVGDGLKSAWTGVSSWFSNTASSIGNFFSNTWNSLKNTGSEIINKVGDGAKSAWNSVSTWFGNTAKSIGDSFSNGVNTMKNIGSNLMDGLKNGIEGGWDTVKNGISTTADKVGGFFKGLFGIKSPSTLWATYGDYLDQGLAKGIVKNTDVILDSVETMSDEVENEMKHAGMNSAVSRLYDALNSDFDNTIVIKPVMDLSEIQNGKDQIFSMMDEINRNSMTKIRDIPEGTIRSLRTNKNITSEDRINPSKKEEGVDVTINNTFNISGGDPNVTAKKISETIQKQVDRRKAKLGFQ